MTEHVESLNDRKECERGQCRLGMCSGQSSDYGPCGGCCSCQGGCLDVDDEGGYASWADRQRRSLYLQDYSAYRPAVVQETACAGRDDLMETLEDISHYANREDE